MPVESQTRTYKRRNGSGRRKAGRRGGAGLDRIGRRPVCPPKTQPLFLVPKSIEDNCFEHLFGSTNKENPM